MVAPTKPQSIVIPPGIQRDGTLLTKKAWTEGQWVRFNDGRALKIGGYQATNNSLNGICRLLDIYWRGTVGYLHSFTANGIDRGTIDAAGNLSVVLNNRTPAGFVTSPDNTWTSDRLVDQASNKVVVVAHATNNIADIGSGTAQPVYYGDADTTAIFVSAPVSVTGGVVVAQPFVFAYDDDGKVQWSASNNVASWPAGNVARITDSKIVAGRSIRTGQSGTGAVFWSLNSLILATFVGGATQFNFSTVSRKTSILSPRCPVEYNGMYFWPGIDSFYVFDGNQVRVLENTMNKRYFYDKTSGINLNRRMVSWGMALPEYEEIIWYYPRGNAQECTHYIVYCVGESRRQGKPIWYDGELGRSAGYPAEVFRYPLKTGTTAPSTLFQHELGVNANGAALNSFIESNTISLVPEGEDRHLLCQRIELDTRQVGNTTWTITGRKYPKGSDTAVPYTVSAGAETIDLKEQRRYLRFKVQSNEIGGDYEIGKLVFHLGVEDAQQKA